MNRIIASQDLDENVISLKPSPFVGALGICAGKKLPRGRGQLFRAVPSARISRLKSSERFSTPYIAFATRPFTSEQPRTLCYEEPNIDNGAKGTL